jgi:ribosomal protein L11 methyltransferase
MDWIEISLTVAPEAEELTVDLLSQFAPDGVSSTPAQVEIISEPLGIVRPAGPVTVRAYLPAEADLEATRAQVEAALLALDPALVLSAVRYTSVANTNWAEAWKVHFQPLRVGRRLMVVPAWLNPPLRPDDLPIRVDPGMAFGTGTHATTQLCLAALEDYLTPGWPVLDLGTGSGILSIAAARLQSGPIVALDIDPEAVRVARENIAVNGVADRIRVEQGSLAEVLAGQFGSVAFPLVVANILASALVKMFGQGLARTLTPDGLIVLSGILASQADEVRAAFEAAGLTRVAQTQSGEWVALVAQRPGDTLQP